MLNENKDSEKPADSKRSALAFAFFWLCKGLGTVTVSSPCLECRLQESAWTKVPYCSTVNFLCLPFFPEWYLSSRNSYSFFFFKRHKIAITAKEEVIAAWSKGYLQSQMAHVTVKREHLGLLYFLSFHCIDVSLYLKNSIYFASFKNKSLDLVFGLKLNEMGIDSQRAEAHKNKKMCMFLWNKS